MQKWGRNACDECGKEFPNVVMIGQLHLYSYSSTAWLCKECLEKAVKLLEEEEENHDRLRQTD